MGSCCTCLKAPDDSDDENSERSSVGGSPSHKKKGYGTIKTESSEPYDGTKETERLVKSGSVRPRWHNKPIKRNAAIPKENLPTDAKEREEEVMSEAGRKGAENAGHVTFAPLLPATHQSEDTTTEDKTVSESETANLVSNEENQEKTTNGKRKKKKKKKDKNISFSVTAKVSKTASKVKKALAKNNKEHISQKQEERSADEVSSGKFERGRHERMSSKRMKSKYAREKMEKIEKEREEREKLKQQSGGFRDPRKAAAERGEKLGELEDAAGAMRNQAAGFAETTRQLAMKK